MVVVYWPLVVAFQEADSCLKLQEARAILSELGQIQHANSTDIDGFICISVDSRYFRYLFVLNLGKNIKDNELMSRK